MLKTVFEKNNTIPERKYKHYNLKRGLRNENGTGVVVGLTQISNVVGYKMEENKKVPTKGQLFYRGISMNKIVDDYSFDGNFRFEETAFLILFGKLPDHDELNDFKKMLAKNRKLPKRFTENMILRIPSKDIMNKLQRSTLVLYSHDDNPDDLSSDNILVQSVSLIAKFPTIISYGYQAKAHYYDKKSLFIHAPRENLSTAENILHMTRIDNNYSELEAHTLDLCLVIHADHGGGNNSAFATHVVASSGTDIYSAISTAVGSLKGPKHGGANKTVLEMIEDIKSNCDYSEISSLKNYLYKILDKQAFDQTGLVYGIGHAVYTVSDPRAEMLKLKAYELAKEKDMIDEYMLYKNIEEITVDYFQKEKNRTICANLDLYSGLVYQMLGIPKELFTPLFAVARVVGWCAHRAEQLLSDPKIIRPAYQDVCVSPVYKDELIR